MDLKDYINQHRDSFEELSVGSDLDQLFEQKLKLKLHVEKKSKLIRLPNWSIAASLFLALGCFYFLVNQDQQVQAERKALLMDLEAGSTGTRLEAVYKIEEGFEKEDQQIIEILLQTLKEDSNANVKIASIDALLKFPNNEKIRLGMIQALKKEDQPLVQIKLINSLSALRETRAKEPLEEIINNQNSFEIVKSNAHLAMSKLNE